MSSSQSSTAAKPHPPTPHPKPPQAGKAPMSFLAEIQAAQKRRGLEEESPEASPPQPKQTPQRPQQTASQGTSHNGGGGVASLQEQLRSRLEARKRSVEESEVTLPEQHPEIRSSVQISSSKEPSEVGVIPPQFMSNSSLSSSFSSTMNSSYSKLDTHTSSSFSAAAHRSLSPERPS